MAFNREINTEEINSFIHDRDPKYKVRAKENVVHDSLGRRSVHHSIRMTNEGLHQLVMIIAAGETRLMTPELVSRVHLGNGQGNRSTIPNAMKSDLPNAHRDVLEATHHQIAPDIQGPGIIVHHQLEGL